MNSVSCDFLWASSLDLGECHSRMSEPMKEHTTTSKPNGWSFLSCFHCGSGFSLSSSITRSPAFMSLATCVLMLLFAAITTFEAPLTLSSWARMRPNWRYVISCFGRMDLFELPVGPAPIISASAPTGACNLSTPWTAQAAGSTSVASMSVRLVILKTLRHGLHNRSATKRPFGD